MNIAVIGTGYVGLVTGACFADFGNNVICVDKDEAKIGKLKNGELPIFEPGLETIVVKNVKEGRLSFTTNLVDAVEKALVVFVAVGTPPAQDGSADLTQISQVAMEIASAINEYKVIVTKSTVPVGAGAYIKGVIEENKTSSCRFSVAANPEFLREGAAINDFMKPDRIVLGCADEEAIAILKDLYRPLYLIETPFVITNTESAEMIKYASNAFLATKVSFINEIANLCERLGANVQDVSKGMGMDERIGSKFLHPGPGFGGSCFPKDAKALVALGRSVGYEMRIVNSTIEVNELQKKLAVRKIQERFGDLSGKVVAILGLAFKPDTDDIREAPSLEIIEELMQLGAKVKVYDPVAMKAASRLLMNVEFAIDEYDAAAGSDAVVVVTEWNQFRSLDIKKLKSLMKSSLMFDYRNIYEPLMMSNAGFEYISLGR
ncbi:MAG: UDP-glucose/GDP-mannose dehydrogenase family protein [Acidobacteriota bacterium]